jgi:hypothetical protein
MSVVVVELRYTEGGGLPDVWVRVLQEVLQVWYGGFDKFPDVNVGHGA